MKKTCIYIGRKLVIFLLSIFLLSLITFYIARLAPGDPLVSYYGDRVEKMSPEERDQAEEKLGLKEPISVQYVKWLKRVAHGDFGISWKYKTDVLEVIKGRLGNTLLLGGIGFVLTFVLALLLGIFCAWKEGSLCDRLICRVGTLTSCIPEFWLSLMLILIFAVELHWLPSSGAYTIGKKNDIGDRILHLILPMSIVVLDHLWYYAYMIRNKILEEVRTDYVLLAKSKGLNRKKILFGHCLRNVIPTYLSLMAISVPHVLGGTYIIESVFSYPGIGTLSYESARYGDYNLLMVLCIFSGILVIFCNMIAQTINERIDPRIRAEEAMKDTKEDEENAWGRCFCDCRHEKNGRESRFRQEKGSKNAGDFPRDFMADCGGLSYSAFCNRKRSFLYGSHEREPGAEPAVFVWNGHDGSGYFHDDLVRRTDFTVYWLCFHADLHGDCNSLRGLKRYRASVGRYVAHAVYGNFLKHSESFAGDPSPGDPGEGKCAFRFTGHRRHELGQHCKSSPDRGAPDPEQRLCDGVTVHGRKLFSCARAASHAEFSAGDPVYGGYECEERDRGGVHTEFHGHGAAPGDGVLGQHAVAGGEGAADRILVDDNCSGRVPGCDTYGYDGGGAVSSEGT